MTTAKKFACFFFKFLFSPPFPPVTKTLMPPRPVLPLLIHTKPNTEYLKDSYHDDISFITLFMQNYISTCTPLLQKTPPIILHVYVTFTTSNMTTRNEMNELKKWTLSTLDLKIKQF